MKILYFGDHSILYLENHYMWYNVLSMPTGHFIRTEEHKRKIGLALKGRRHPWQEKVKIEKVCAYGNKFYLNPSKNILKHGKYCSRSCYLKYKDNSFFLKMITTKGEEHWNYKGNKAGYKALHLRVSQIRGKADYCSDDPSHKSNKYEWANLTGKYEDPNDYKSLCHKCHNKFDNVGKKGWETRKKTSTEASKVSKPTEGGVLRE